MQGRHTADHLWKEAPSWDDAARGEDAKPHAGSRRISISILLPSMVKSLQLANAIGLGQPGTNRLKKRKTPYFEGRVSVIPTPLLGGMITPPQGRRMGAMAFVAYSQAPQ